MPHLTAQAALAILACCVGVVSAQTAQTAQTAPQVGNAARPVAIEQPANTNPSSSNQLIERIRVENSEVRIDEVRFGGETRSISVAPKGRFPAYDVQPKTGERTWKILDF